MSEDGLSDPNDEPSMELFIETLTGTSFEMRVFPTDTVLDIKNKIHRDEGIPVHHQNLLFQMKELQDYARLSDVGIVSGSTLKMVLSMRGGPISTRRLNTCDHHIIWKDLKDLIEHTRTRDEVGDKSGSKVSVVVFKEGEVINVIRVIENEDGTYSPYTEKAISPPYSRHKEKDDVQQTFFKKISEDMEMATKIHVLKSKMKKLRQQRNSKEVGDAVGKAETSKSDASHHHLPKAVGAGGDFLSYETNPSTSRSVENSRSSKRLTFDEKIVHESLLDHLENGEIALKEKHRSRIRLSPNDKIKKVDKLRTAGDAKPYFCKNLHVFEPDRKDKTDDEKLINSSILSPLYNRIPPGERHRRPTPFDNNFDDGKHPEPISILKDQDHANPIEVPCSETLSLSARNRVHLARLVLPDAEHGKSSPDSIELEENSQEMWEIQPDNIKSGGSYKVGLLKRRTSVDHNYESDFGLETSTSNLDRDDYNRQNGGEYEVFGRNLYHVPQYVSAPSAIPPQYAPKDESICDFYLGSPVPDATIRRSPLYGRRSKNSGSNIDYNIYAEEASSLERSLESLGFDDGKKFPKLRAKSENNFSDLASNIERLQNDFSELDYEDFDVNYGDDMFGYYNSSCTAELDKILNSNNPRYKDSLWSDMERIRGIATCSHEDAQLANEIKRLGFDLKIDDDKRSTTAVQIETSKLEALPAVVSKKRMRCGQCNKRLNITNIYNCRCGRIFCSQHRYSETHDCKYDYKSEGRKLLEQQNPLVTATKLSKF